MATRTSNLLCAVWLALALSCLTMQAQSAPSVQKTRAAQSAPSGLDRRSFSRYWTVESESDDYLVTFSGDTCEVTAPKGLTLWRKEKMSQNMAVEYDVLVTDDRLSDMNCFWMASDPEARTVFDRMDERRGVFKNCYALQMYYLGYGGNHNTTTRFRRYTGGGTVPPVWLEYTDEAHLLRSGHWYHWRVESRKGRTRFFVDGELIADYLDPEPLQSGWFGFRTTLSRVRLTNFRTERLSSEALTLHWVGTEPQSPQPVTFGVPFAQGERRDLSELSLPLEADTWVTARWPDGSVKWAAVSGVTKGSGDGQLTVTQSDGHLTVTQSDGQWQVNTGRLTAYLPRQGETFIDSLVIDGLKVGGSARLVASTTQDSYTSYIHSITIERQGRYSAVVKTEGVHRSPQGRQWLPFVLRLYFWQGSEQVKLVHTFTYDGEQTQDFITSLGLQFRVPMRTEDYNRHIAFAIDTTSRQPSFGGGLSLGDNLQTPAVWHEPVQPLDGRRPLERDTNWQKVQMEGGRIPSATTFDDLGQQLLREWARWDDYRLSQLTDNAFSIRKRATTQSPWTGTLTGQRAPGFTWVGDVEGGLGIGMKDFWQSYPSTILVEGARSAEARVTMYLWSPEAEPMNLCHYDTVAHGLLSSYEDVQQGMSTPYGIARTSTLWLLPFTGRPQMDTAIGDYRLLPTPEYLHARRAFGLWSLPSAADDQTGDICGDRAAVERRLADYIRLYQQETERCKWYGFWNYGDVMHAYDEERQEWRYDVGGYAWDNTELATPMWLWYNFLRTGRTDIWRMAEAMTRHNSEVDTYHMGPFAPLGSRHNVSHWGCGAKEARISQSAFLRFYYYLTADERTGDLMTAQTDCDTLLYHLDPMRLAEPREQYPCSAPARLRFGPDWLAYAGNWMTQWERTGDTRYRDKIVNGLQSVTMMTDGLFTGNKAWGYDPDTGRMSYDGPDSIRHTNHLATIMGGFEVMNELLPLVSGTLKARGADFDACWRDYARRYRLTAWELSQNKFPVRRLDAYSAWRDRDAERRHDVWQSLLRRPRGISTNDAALWSLDAIYMLEVIPPND